MSSSSPPRSCHFGSSLVPYLTTAAHVSAPFITTFLLIHLTAPVMANVGGSELASQTMLLGREYYQTSFGETYLVLGPIVAHSFSAIAKRILSPPPGPRSPKSLLTITGYALLGVFLPIHYLTHRVNPALPDGPILELGPSELDYEFVKYGLGRWPLTSWILYGGLLVCVTGHVVDGMAILWNARLATSFGRLKQNSRKPRLAVAGIGMVLPVMMGMFCLWKEPLMSFASMAKRFEGVYLRSWVYRL